MVHAQSACRASEASRVMRHPLFQRGPRGLLGHKHAQAAEHAQPVRAFNNVEREFCAWREGQGMRLPSAGRQPTRQPVRVRHEFVPREFWRAPQTERAAKRLFLSPSAFFEPAKKVRKNSNRKRPVAVSRDTSPKKSERKQREPRGTRPLSIPAVGYYDLAWAASLSRRNSVVPESRAKKTARAAPPPSTRAKKGTLCRVPFA